MSTINVNYMTRNYNSFTQKQETRNVSGKSMADTIAEKVSKSETSVAITETTKIGAVSKEDMSMEEYKEYIRDEISKIPLSPRRMNDTIAINISEAGFEAMKNDPEYEKWVLDGIREDFACNHPLYGICGGNYCVKNFGARKEDYHGEIWSPEYQNGNGKNLWESKSQNSFWERKVDTKTQMSTQMKKQQERDRIEQEIFEKTVRNKRLVHQRLLTEYQNRSFAAKSAAAKVSSAAVTATQSAVSSYEANFMMPDNII